MIAPSDRRGWLAVRPVIHAAIVIALSLAYPSSVFAITHRELWTSGLGDWMDPYFINALLVSGARRAMD